MTADSAAQPDDENMIDRGTLQHERVDSRAEGRPPEERSSQDAKTQAEAILEDSDERVAQRLAAVEDKDPS